MKLFKYISKTQTALPSRSMRRHAPRFSGKSEKYGDISDTCYCGDSMKFDVMGAHGTGILPVLYEGETHDDVDTFAEGNIST